MSLNILSSQSRFTFHVLASPHETALVSFGVSESISGTFSEHVLLAAIGEIKTFDEIIGRESLLTVINSDRLAGGGGRYFHCVVRKFEYAGMSGRKYLYEADVVPSVYFLSQRKNCRIFQETTTQEIISTILEEAGITSDHYRFALVDTDRKRGFCVQYRESDLDFISRLMEEEGIFYFFEHYRDKHVLVMSDNLAVHVPIKGGPTITCNSGDGLVADRESVQHFTFSQRRTPQAFAYSNFSFKCPDLNLTMSRAEAKRPHYEIYEYAALHTSQAQGDMLAQVRMEQLVSLQKQGHGESSSCRLTPGYKVTLTGHDSQILNAEYLLIEVSHFGSQPQTLEEHAGGGASYGNHFTAVPATTQYRPALNTPRPVVSGLQTAIVVGPKGEEIHTDEHGRVKVQFHWDREGQRDDRSSCWLRVTQAWGGLSRGGQFVPRIGDEVLVDFLEGNPDWPILVGSVYNGGNMPINNLKKSVTQTSIKTKTHKGEGFHELRFDDAKGKEEVFLHSQKDMNVMVLDRRGETIGGDSGTVISKNCDLSVGGDSYTIVKGKSTEIGKEIIINADDSVTIVCGTSSIVIAPAGIKINGLQVDINDKSKAPKPPKRPVTGCTGRGGSGGGGKQSGGSAAKRDSQSAATPQQAIKEKPGKVASPVSEDTLQAEINGNSSGLGDFVSTGSPSPLLPTGGRTVPGDLVSSAGASLPSGLQNNIVGNGSALDNVAGLKDKAIREIKDRAAQELDKYKGSLLEKSGIGDMHSKMSKISEKPANLLSDTKINPDDLIKKF